MKAHTSADDRNDELPDRRLQAALRHAPDAGEQPGNELDQRILDAARAAVMRPRAAAAGPTPWWQRLLDGLLRPPAAAALATVVLGTVIGVLWQGEVPPEALPAPPDSTTAAAPPSNGASAPGPAAERPQGRIAPPAAREAAPAMAQRPQPAAPGTGRPAPAPTTAAEAPRPAPAMAPATVPAPAPVPPPEPAPEPPPTAPAPQPTATPAVAAPLGRVAKRMPEAGADAAAPAARTSTTSAAPPSLRDTPVEPARPTPFAAPAAPTETDVRETRRAEVGGTAAAPVPRPAPPAVAAVIDDLHDATRGRWAVVDAAGAPVGGETLLDAQGRALGRVVFDRESVWWIPEPPGTAIRASLEPARARALALRLRATSGLLPRR